MGDEEVGTADSERGHGEEHRNHVERRWPPAIGAHGVAIDLFRAALESGSLLRPAFPNVGRPNDRDLEP